MRVSCPACNAELSLEALLSRDVDARAVAHFLERHLALGDVLLRYLALFRPPKRRLGIARMVALLEELLPDIERGAVRRKGRDWPAPHAVWREALERVLGMRDKGNLTLPLTSHALLHEVISSLADRAEARAETEAEAERRNRRGSATAAAPRSVAELAEQPGGTPPLPAPPAYTGPSRAARELKARMQAALAAKAGVGAATESSPATTPTGEPAA